jgi:uncharacterized protein YgbK (DUF1537 family)
MSPEEAVDTVKQTVATLKQQYGVEYFYKKIDSTLRGNIAWECLAVLEEMAGDCAIIVPAFPRESRQTVGGYHLLRGQPIERTEVSRDPLYPVKMSHLPTLLAQQIDDPAIIGHVSLSTVMHGAGPILRSLQEQMKAGKLLIVVDATCDEDMDQVALAIEKLQQTKNILPCGSAGLAIALSRLWPEPSHDACLIAPVFGPTPTVILSGSLTPITREQLHRLMEYYPHCYPDGSRLEVVPLTPEQLLGLAPVDEVMATLDEALNGPNTIIVSTAMNEASYQKTLALAEANQISPDVAPTLSQMLLTRITQHIAAQRKDIRLVLTGGETATHICDGLGLKHLRMLCEVAPNIPLSRDNVGRYIVTKSGNFGDPLTLIKLVDFFKQNEMDPEEV